MNERQVVTSDSTSRTMGREAQKNNIMAARIVSDIIKTTLGPLGMDKMLVDSGGNITVTNDGVTILNEMEIEHPAAKMLVEIARTQEKEVGDGTTTVVLLAGKLLERAERLLEKRIHPTTIVSGYSLASQKAHEILNDLSIDVRDSYMLKKIALTAMTGKGAEANKDLLSELIVKSVEKTAEGKKVNLEDIRIEKIRGDELASSDLVDGFVLSKGRANKEMPSLVENAKILLIDFPVEVRSPEKETKITISTPEQLDSFLDSEDKYIRDLSNRIISSGANVVFCQKGIDDVAQYYLAKAGIFAVRRVPRSDMETLARATSGRIVSNESEISSECMGFAGKVEEEGNDGEPVIYISKCKNPKAVSIIIRGSSIHILDEAERAVRDGLGVVVSAIKYGKIVAGGGAVEIEVSRQLKIYARSIGGKQQLAIEEFASALESVPETLAENAGLDPIDVLTEIKRKHELGNTRQGLDLFTNKVCDTFEAGIIEPLKVKTQAISSATEVSSLILRIDDVLMSSGKKEELEKVQRSEIID